MQRREPWPAPLPQLNSATIIVLISSLGKLSSWRKPGKGGLGQESGPRLGGVSTSCADGGARRARMGSAPLAD